MHTYIYIYIYSMLHNTILYPKDDSPKRKRRPPGPGEDRQAGAGREAGLLS